MGESGREEEHGGPGGVEVLPRSLRYATAEGAVAPVGMTPQEGFIAQKACDGKEYLAPKTPLGMTGGKCKTAKAAASRRSPKKNPKSRAEARRLQRQSRKAKSGPPRKDGPYTGKKKQEPA